MGAGITHMTLTVCWLHRHQILILFVSSSRLVAVVHGDSCSRVQPLEEQWNQLLCERRTGVLWRYSLVCQHQWRKCICISVFWTWKNIPQITDVVLQCGVYILSPHVCSVNMLQSETGQLIWKQSSWTITNRECISCLLCAVELTEGFSVTYRLPAAANLCHALVSQIDPISAISRLLGEMSVPL